MLLIHYYTDKKLTATLIMEPTSQGRLSVNTGSTVAKHRSIAPHLLSAHALTGCDTVAPYFGIGKTKVIKALEAGHRLSHPMVSLEDVFCESAAFVAACYGQKCEVHETMTDVCYKVWVSKTDEKVHAYNPNLKQYHRLTKCLRKTQRELTFRHAYGKLL